MSREWGRAEFGAKWPTDKPIGVILAVLASVVSAGAIVYNRYERDWPYVERLYLKTYLAAGVARIARPAGYYTLPLIIDRKVGLRLPRVGEVVPAVLPNGLPGVALTERAVQHGAMRLEWKEHKFDNDRLHRLIRHWVFQDQTWWDLTRPACYGGLGVLLLGLCVGIPRDMRATKVRRQGRLVRGPLVVTRDQFNRKRKKRGRTDGIGFITTEPQSLRERLFMTYRYGPMVQIPREDETRHHLFMGTTASGKSTAIKQVLIQARDAGETAIIHDPTLEYIRSFYDPGRGDIILNPLDERAPYWSPGEEVEHEAEALTIAHALFPDQPRETPFFLNSVRKLVAHVLRFHPRPEQLVEWMSNPSKIDELVRGTPYEATIRQTAPGQREGVLATMNNVADILAQLKTEKDAQQHWTAREWVKRRQGWIFLTSTPATRESLKPLHSLWLDLLILRLLHQADDPTVRQVWMDLDEVATLQRLPQLETALTQNRKANTSILLGLQGKAQLETIYGHIAETLLAMPWTALFFKTTEPEAAEWISRYLGVQEIERWRPSQTSGASGSRRRRESKTDAEERFNRQAVSASEISGLPERKAYLKSGNFIVPLTVARLDLPNIAGGFIPHQLRPMFPVRTEPKNNEPEDDASREQEQKRQTGQGRAFFK
jgi:type IV secretory pathway TraG/TraD family ATPase VirD4